MLEDREGLSCREEFDEDIGGWMQRPHWR